MSSRSITVEKMESWITARVVEYGSVEGDCIDPETRLADLGFSSVYALTLCGDIEDEFDIEVDPTIVGDHPTIRELAEAVLARIGDR